MDMKKRVKIYLCNGMVKEYPYLMEDTSASFFIQEIEDKCAAREYKYPGDSIKYELGNQLVDIYDLFRRKLLLVFTD